MHNSSTYYTLELASGTKETGPVYPQIQKMTPGYDDKKDNSIYSYLKKSIETFPKEEPDLDGFIMHRQAKPTDMVSNSIASGAGFFVTQRLKTILEKHHLPPHRFYPAKVTHNGKALEGYFWMHIISDITDFVDYPNSTFFVYQRYKPSLGQIKVSSKEDLLNKEKSLKAEYPNTYTVIHAEEISLKQQTNKELDLFQIGEFDFDFYISQSLKNSFIENNITGVEIKPTDKISIQ